MDYVVGVKTTQTTIDLASVKLPGKSYPAKIVSVELRTAGEIFGDKTKKNDGQTQEEAMSRPVYEIKFAGEGFVGNAVLTKSESAKSNLAKFVMRYGTVLGPGVVVSARLDSEGQARLEL
jgi:hypothetical protein